MARLLLLHGAGSSGWYWHRVTPRLRAAGHETAAPDLPADDPTAGLDAYVDAAVDAVADRPDEPVVVVAQSMAGVYAPVITVRRPVARIVLLAAMIPAPGERGHDWWANTGQEAAQREALAARGLDVTDLTDPPVVFLHDVPTQLWPEAARRERQQHARPFEDPSPIAAWPDVPTCVLAARDDRMFPLAFMRRVAQHRLGLEVEVIPGGHLPALSHPEAVADALLRQVNLTDTPSTLRATRVSARSGLSATLTGRS